MRRARIDVEPRLAVGSAPQREALQRARQHVPAVRRQCAHLGQLAEAPLLIRLLGTGLLVPEAHRVIRRAGYDPAIGKEADTDHRSAVALQRRPGDDL